MVVDDLYLGWGTPEFMLRNLVDPSLAAALIGLTTVAAMKANPYGFQRLFVCLALRDLHVYARHNDVYLSAWPGQVTEHPVYVVERDLGPGLVFVVAANRIRIDAAALELRRQREARPSGLHAVLTTGAAVGRRSDGIWEIPLSCLGP